jgi:Flp pilus assembly protein TadG
MMAVELLFVLPVLLIVVFAIIEFGCLWSANIRVKAASQAACRVATLPAETPEEMMLAVNRTAAQSLGSANLVSNSHIRVDPAEYSGDPVTVEVRVPMPAAAPNMLAIFGMRLEGRELIGRTVMRKE